MVVDDSVLEDYRRWLLKMATVIAPYKREVWHDLAQEGWVAMWRALRTYDADKGALPAWLTTAARLRMTDVWRRDTWLGTPMVRGHVREKPATPIDTDDDFVTSLLGSAPDVFDTVEWGYHEGDIWKALNTLSPKQREYVIRRFWFGHENKELKAHFGYDPSVLWSGKPSGAKIRLARALRHLASV